MTLGDNDQRMAMMNNFTGVVLLFPILGVGLFVGGLVYRRRLNRNAAGCERTEGTVIDNVHGIPGKGRYCPVVEYRVGNERFTITGDNSYDPAKVKGSTLTVLFRPANPSEGYIEEGYYVLANVMLGIGAGFILLSLWAAYGSM